MTDDEQVGPERGNPVTKALRTQNRRLSLLQEQVDALSSLENASRERLDALYEHFLRHVHEDAPGDENAVNAQETRQERERHEG